MNKEQFSILMTHDVEAMFADYRFSETFIERGEKALTALPPVNDDSWNEEFAEHVLTKLKEEDTDRFLKCTVIKDNVVYPENENPTTEEIEDEILHLAAATDGIPEDCVAVLVEIAQVFQNVITDRAV